MKKMLNNIRNTTIAAILLYGLAIASSVYALTIVSPQVGGTGASTTPSFGSVLMGNASGTYSVVSTSSLGISGTGAVNYLTLMSGGLRVATGTDFFQAAMFIATGTATSTFVGNVSAPYFIGDGSLLTGISGGGSFSTSSARNSVSSTATGLSYATSTGVFSLTSGYVIPLTASTTVWDGKFTLPSFTAGSIPFSNGTTLLQDNAYLFWNTASKALGLGTTTPRGVLHVTGQAGTTTPNAIVSSASGTTQFIVLSNGNVGIGTNNPTSELNVAGTTTLQGKLNMTANNDGLASMDALNSLTFIDTDTGSVSNQPMGQFIGYSSDSAPNAAGINSRLKFITADSSGNGGVVIETGVSGTTTEIARFQKGALAVGAPTPDSRTYVVTHFQGDPAVIGSNPVFKFQNLSSTGSSELQLLISNSSTNASSSASVIATRSGNNVNLGLRVSNTNVPNDAFTILGSNGNVGIGTTSPVATLSASGTVNLANLTAAGSSMSAACFILGNNVTKNTGLQDCNSSSIRWKENITLMGDALKKIVQLRPSEYNRKDTKKKEMGMIAEEVDKVDPRLVGRDDNGQVVGLQIPGLVAMAIRSIQQILGMVDEHGIVIDRQAEEIRNLNQRLNALEERAR